MKTLSKILIAFILIISVESCKKEKQEPKTIYAKWELVSNNLFNNDLKFLIINHDKVTDQLLESEQGFRKAYSGISVITDDQILMSYGQNLNYVLNEDQLSIFGLNDKKAVFKRSSSAPTKSEWITEVSILAENSSSWLSDKGIAFNGSHILHSPNISSPFTVYFINPNTFNVDNEDLGHVYSEGIAVEKSASPSRLIFRTQSNRFYGYTEDTNVEMFVSDDFENLIYRIASLDSDNIWIIDNKGVLKLYKYTGIPQILKTIPLDINRLRGITYQDDFLYLTSNEYIYKCQTQPDFKVIETYKLPIEERGEISGITFDGSHFWVNNRSYSTSTEDEKRKLIKIDLGI